MKQKTIPEKKQIVILGGGFAGIRAALDLNNYLHDDDQFEIVLVDRRDYQTFYSALYEAATTEHWQIEARSVKRTVTIPLIDVFKNTRVKVFKAFIERIDLQDGKVVTDSRIIAFDYLIISMGSVANYFGIPNLDKFSFTLKSLEDAIMIRNKVEDLVTKKDSAQIVIGGAGFAGTEFAGELHNLLKHECAHHNKDLSKFKILIVEGGTYFLPGLPEKVSSVIAPRMAQMGIESRFSTLITEAGSNYVMLNNKERVEMDMLIWTGGVKAIKLPVEAELPRDKSDRIGVEQTLNLRSFPNVFLAGDVACALDPKTKKVVLQTAQEAISQGKHVATNVYRMIKNKNLLPYDPISVKFIVPVAGKFAVFYTPNLMTSGFAGWVIRKAADLRYFMSVLPFFTALKFWLFANQIFMKND